MSPKKENKPGLPNLLKANIENLSGCSMDDVKVHFDSVKPEQLKARALALGKDMHTDSTKEKQLPHEAWQVVQQQQGRVDPAAQLKNEAVINATKELEKEADAMGEKAAQTPSSKDSKTK